MAQAAIGEAAVKKLIAEGGDSVEVAQTVKRCSETTRIFRSSVAVAQQLSSQFTIVLAVLLVLFILHQSTPTHPHASPMRVHPLSRAVSCLSFHLDRPGPRGRL